MKLTVAAVFASSSMAAVDIGSRLELFVDRYLIQELNGVELKLHEPVRSPIRGQAPQGLNQPPASHYMTVIKDGDLYRAYYRDYIVGYQGPQKPAGLKELTVYAESRNGYEWTTPQLGLFEINGSRANNAILAHTPPFTHNFAPFLDTNPAARKDQRFKALAGNKFSGLHAFVSADGLHWSQLQDGPVFQPVFELGGLDSHNSVFWSEVEQQYVCYFRINLNHRRAFHKTTSKDFVTWTPGVPCYANETAEDLYTSGAHPYFRAPHITIALPTRFMPGRGSSTDIVFMAARDGGPFQRLFREAFIRAGLDPERWGNRANYVALNLVPTGPGEMSIYHALSGYRYVLRTDGFVSVHAGADAGELLTKPVLFSGKKLVVNFSTSAAGQIRIGIEEADGRSIPGYTLTDCPEIVGDRIEHTVTWKQGADVSSLAGRPVRLRVSLQDADLYSLRFFPE